MLIGFLFHVNSLFFESERGDQNRLGIYRNNNHKSLHLHFLQPLGSRVLPSHLFPPWHGARFSPFGLVW